MLDNGTKRRIDTARDILVGKVPDPKSQVEQITIALIYKFMDDMDADAEEMGGHRSFFTGEFEKYGWAKLMAPGRGGYEVQGLYEEGITRMNENSGIPLLFRDIFKNAHLPYRDPETLKSFLKVIDDFTYDHSERLGDAFEYLLSVLGSQGDAGQFRTPRHIIEFMVQVIDPQKHESILDPACGTAGFLISSFKHVMANNSLNGRPGAALTPDERTRLMNQIKGYDISPDMVRLSLVNLYLHGFNDPHIVEYDTLTSEDRWNEYADIIMANPPFMSPKGGIPPHKRFSVQSSRSEVLFVDYMAEHLSPGGRAAIIVPEGVIFQSGNAYKQLRKMLVEKYLVGVISLPAGVFNPYSGVKTSILWLDKALAKQTDQIAFVKVGSDGFDLGAQRREIKQNELPEALAAITAYKASIVNNTPFDTGHYDSLALVDKSEIAQNGDYNLSGERYRSTVHHIPSKWPNAALGDVCTFMTGGTPTSTVREYYDRGQIPWLVSGDIHQGEIFDCAGRITESGVANSNAKYLPKDSVLIALNGQGKTRGTVAILRMEKATCNQSLVSINPTDKNKLLPEFLLYQLRSLYQDIRNITGDNQRSGLNIPIIKSIRIVLPPLAVQEEIVAEIESYQKIVDGARQVVENWRPRIFINPDWPMVDLEEHIEFISGLTLSIPEAERAQGTPIISMNSITEWGELVKEGIREIELPKTKTINYLQKGDLLFNWRNGSKRLVGKTGYFDWDGDYVFASFLLGIRPKKESYSPKFLWVLLNQYRAEEKYMSFMRQNVNGLFNREELKILKVPLPDIPTQERIVTEIENEQRLVSTNDQLITLFELKIKDRIARVWGED